MYLCHLQLFSGVHLDDKNLLNFFELKVNVCNVCVDWFDKCVLTKVLSCLVVILNWQVSGKYEGGTSLWSSASSLDCLPK